MTGEEALSNRYENRKQRPENVSMQVVCEIKYSKVIKRTLGLDLLTSFFYKRRRL